MDAVREALSRAADGVYAVDWKYSIVFWNSAAERILGYRAEEIEGTPCHELFHGNSRPGYLTQCPDCPSLIAARGGDPIPAYNLFTHTKDGTEILLNVSVIVPPAADSPFAVIHLFRDVTHQWHYERFVNQLRSNARRLSLPQATLGHLSDRTLPLRNSLTPRERDVLALLVSGHSLREIANTLNLSYATVRNHNQHLLHKFGVHSQREIVQNALEYQLV